MKQKKIPQFVIAAPCSGSGKTTVSRGLMAAFVQRGMCIQPYKCGPDYIDTKFHATVCGRPSVNLDSFMASTIHVRRLYAHYAAGADGCVVEGMMGLFDGYHRYQGSSSDIAEILNLPVILVVDAASTAYSLAALLQGFVRFRSTTRIVGVIFNRVGSENHYRMLQDVCRDVNITCLGYLPKDKLLEQSSRYLGLDFSDGAGEATQAYLVQQIESHIDIPLLLASTSSFVRIQDYEWENQSFSFSHAVVFRDEEAFSFLYTEHVDYLQRKGKVTFLNPFANETLPADTDFLYLPGGYPEKYAKELAAAEDTIQSVCHYIESGGRALAECGGMIYLSKGIHTDDELHFIPLCGVLPFSISSMKEHRKLQLGYRQFDYKGIHWCGHEFHYTGFYLDDHASLPISVAQVYNARQQPVSSPVFRYKNLLASYIHLYWGENGLALLF